MNDETPVFEKDVYTKSLPEDLSSITVNETFFTISATDGDLSEEFGNASLRLGEKMDFKKSDRFFFLLSSAS